ncbi:hypothetical protein KVR01_012844 [Diaporthe batatas]|uniref:uncharacterized protein n=1 Tax=Diaporthe batatas TaxID=748121 RepID=UPI001D048DE1|nr:uncharacterized protein KVR01_012844 [Diaporthe batatas]KAG8157460.1 hypothetical protein KVR01_012844 [Diaporthe batatas]
MGHFDHCTPDQRFTITFPDMVHETGTKKVIIDWDQRRFIAVGTAWKEVDEDFFLCALAEHIDDIPSDVTRIEVGEHGELLKCITDPEEDQTSIPFYPSPSDYPALVPQIRREQLVEISRMGVQVDLCEYASTPGLPPQQVAFKYYINEGNMAVVWDEGNCLLHMPKHPNIIQFHSLVVDQIEGQEKVVGFTTPFIPGGTIEDNISRPFKLKHLRQLTSTIDYLNLELGISHSDITLYNLLIDETTDNIIIFDFNTVGRMGRDNDPARNDIKFTAFTLYEIITRDTHLREENYPEELDMPMVLNTPDWEKHEDVVLDAPVEEYRRHLDEWIATRQADLGERAEEEKAGIPGGPNQPPNALDWPPLPELPYVLFVGTMLNVRAQIRRELVRNDMKFLTWQRPPSCELPLPEGKKLLATGEVVEMDYEVS